MCHEEGEEMTEGLGINVTDTITQKESFGGKDKKEGKDYHDLQRGEEHPQDTSGDTDTGEGKV